MKYSIEVGKIVEGALKHDKIKVLSYTKQLISKLQEEEDIISANKFNKLLNSFDEKTLSPMSSSIDSKLPIDTESRTTLADIIMPNENNIKVILSKDNTHKINTFILNYKNADKLNSLGLGVSNTLLLYGPPGCGKTKCAYLIAKELNLPLVIARLDSIISSYLGTTAKNIRTLFEYTQRIPCVLFLDEFDALAKARDDNNEMGELKRVVNSLLQNIDAMSENSLLIAATNHDKLLDSAIWRRFDYKLDIELPDNDAIVQMINLFTNNTEKLSNKEKYDLAMLFFGLSGADIEDIITKALRFAIIYEREFNKNNIYDEYFNYKKVIPQNCTDDKIILRIKSKHLRECNPKIFSLQVIADILNSSKTTIQKVIKEADTQ